MPSIGLIKTDLSDTNEEEEDREEPSKMYLATSPICNY